ncbi:MAG: DNA primase small subunit domain-containing protein [Candidatus Diapherotrites archaeon]
MQEEFNFLKGKIRQYYVENDIPAPEGISKKEFGIGDYGKKITSRHLAFNSPTDFNSYLKRESPFYISYSTAFYEFPERRPMAAKNLEGADLIYEFDADDLKTGCKEEHDSWKCKCGEFGKGNIELCPKCGLRVEVEEWVCEKCLGAAKQQVFSLLKVLNNDFDMNEGIYVNFSGGKGYHVHVRGKYVRELSPPARIELLDYLTANEISIELLGFRMDKKITGCPKPGNLSGWSEKLMSSLIYFFENTDEAEMVLRTGTSYSAAKKIIADKKKIIEAFNRGSLIAFPGKRGQEFWSSLLNSFVDDLKIDVDRQTSVDIYKIVRVPETIHGGTGLIAKEIELDSLKNFNPLKETIAFGGESVKIKTSKIPRFYLGEREWGPFDHEEAELPAFAAAYLIARNSANLS